MSATTTTAAAFRAALLDLLAVDATLAAAMVSFEPVSDPPRATVTMGDEVEWSGEVRTMKDGRKHRDGEYVFSVVFMVSTSQAQRDNEATAVALMGALEDLLADSPTLSDAVSGVQWAQVTEWDMTVDKDADGFAEVELSVDVTVKEILR